MHFLYKGLLLVLDPSSFTSTSVLLRPGAHFGETAMLERHKRQNSVASVTTSEVHELTRNAFNDVVDDHPDFARRVRVLRNKRRVRMQVRTGNSGNCRLVRGGC